MVQITVSDDLARAIAEAGWQVTLVDSCGHAVAKTTPIEDADCPSGMTTDRWKEIKRRMQEPGTYVSFQEIKKRLGW